MIDSVGLKHYYKGISSDRLHNRWKFLSKARNPTWVFNENGQSVSPRLTFVETPNGICHLSAEVSLPKLIFGHNAKLPGETEVFEGLKLISAFVEEQSSLNFNFQTATVSLVHFSRDFQLGESEVWAAIERLSKKRMKGMVKTFFEDTTIYFTSKGRSKQIRIYPKLQEVLAKSGSNQEAIEAARGKLRFEYCLQKRYAIDAFVVRNSLPDNKVQTIITKENSDLALTEVLEEIGFYNVLSNEKKTLEKLLDFYSPTKAMSLFGFLEMVKQYGTDFYADPKVSFSENSYKRNVRACREAKAW